MNQSHGPHTAAIMIARATGRRFARIGDGRTIPLPMLPLAAGADEWMRHIIIKCSHCRAPHPAGEMEAGYADLCCQLCFDSIMEDAG